MRVDEVPDRGVSSDEDEAPERGTDAAGFEEPEEPLDGHVEDRLGRLLARREVNHMGNALGSRVDDLAAIDRAGDDLESRRRLQRPVVAQRSDRDLGQPLVVRGEHPPDERLADLAGRAGDEDQRRRLHPLQACSLRYWCTKAIAMLPSPTAAATRLTGLNRTSPQAKMPGTLVSRRYGSRSSGHRPAALTSGPVSTYPFASSAISGGSHAV